MQIVVPESSVLHPSLDAGVVGGNVLTSQRVVDVIFRAFEVCAASQVRGAQKGLAGGLELRLGSHSCSARAWAASCRRQLGQEVAPPGFSGTQQVAERRDVQRPWLVAVLRAQGAIF